MKKLSKNEWIAVGAGVVFVGYTLFGANIMGLFQKFSGSRDNLATANESSIQNVLVSDIVVGEGKEIKKGDLASVHYILSLSDGATIQNSRDFGAPFQFMMGAGDVIPGWEKGLVGMKVGGVRTIVIPPELGYGSVQTGAIPPNSTLIFTIELLNVEPQRI